MRMMDYIWVDIIVIASCLFLLFVFRHEFGLYGKVKRWLLKNKQGDL